MIVPMVQLTPRGWVPNPQLTGDNMAPQTIHISHTFWMALNQPQSIEEYYEQLAALEAAPVTNIINFRGFQGPQELSSCLNLHLNVPVVLVSPAL